MKREFTIDNCFPNEVPVNAEEIVEFLNGEAVRRGVYSYDFEDDTGAYVMDQIWEDYCNGKLGHGAVLEQAYVVEFAVDGRAYVEARGRSPEEAAKVAERDFGSVDLGELECVGFKAVKAYDENDDVIDDYDVANGDWYKVGEEQDYCVGFAVDCRAYVTVFAGSPAEAVRKAEDDFCLVALGNLEVVGWKPVNVKDEKGKLNDDERDLFGSVDGVISEAVGKCSELNKDNNGMDIEIERG